MTRDDIIKWARQAGVSIRGHYDETGSTQTELQRFAELVAAAEREECAKVCEQRKIITPEWQLDQHYNQGASHCAAAIRARSGKGTTE